MWFSLFSLPGAGCSNTNVDCVSGDNMVAYCVLKNLILVSSRE